MSGYALSHDLLLLSNESDRRFRRLVTVFFIPALIAGIAIPLIQIAGLQKGGGDEVPRYAKLLAPTKSPEVEPQPEKTQTKPKPQLTQEQKVEKARKKVSKMLSSFDQLAELRDATLPTNRNAKLSSSVITSRSGTTPSFSSDAAKTSGGIGEVGVVRREDSKTGLGQRQSEAVHNPAEKGQPHRPGSGQEVVGRTIEEINLVFDRKKSLFLSIYQRALRDDPNLSGKIVMSLTIAPDGSVTDCRVVGSNGTNPSFESKILSAVRLLNFGAKKVPPVTFTAYPIYLL